MFFQIGIRMRQNFNVTLIFSIFSWSQLSKHQRAWHSWCRNSYWFWSGLSPSGRCRANIRGSLESWKNSWWLWSTIFQKLPSGLKLCNAYHKDCNRVHDFSYFSYSPILINPFPILRKPQRQDLTRDPLKGDTCIWKKLFMMSLATVLTPGKHWIFASLCKNCG